VQIRLLLAPHDGPVYKQRPPKVNRVLGEGVVPFDWACTSRSNQTCQGLVPGPVCTPGILSRHAGAALPVRALPLKYSHTLRRKDILPNARFTQSCADLIILDFSIAGARSPGRPKSPGFCPITCTAPQGVRRLTLFRPCRTSAARPCRGLSRLSLPFRQGHLPPHSIARPSGLCTTRHRSGHLPCFSN